jgi:hypothetical protein
VLWTFVGEFVCQHVFSSLGYILQSGVAGPRGKAVFTF